MNEQQAKWLLDETFNRDYDNLKFLNFLKELVNNSKLSIQDKSVFIPAEFKDYILKVEKLGQYNDKAGKTMELLAIRLAKHSSLERARTMQRNFIAKWLAKNPAEPEGAIVAFYDGEEDWRFSFVKLEYSLIKDEKGNLKAKKELTPAKRYSFLVGPNEPNHTCKKQFVGLLADDKHDPTFEEIEKAFSIEKVTKEFFEEYKKRFLDLKDSLEKVVTNDPVVKADFVRIVGDDEDDLEKFIIEFSKKLLGQIVFLYFLQKKGWLGVGKSETGKFKEWGTGPKDFMKRLFNKEYGGYNNFFNDILEHLFYDTLAKKRDDDYCRFGDVVFRIPFLNGGLFEPLDGYDWVNTNIYLENSIFEQIFKTFDEFNFTVKEDEPLEKEVAVDPEMLGKVFENLLDVIDRKSKGAFYTPREIVHYMCQQSLINYLETNSSIDRKDIERFIQEGDKFLDQAIKAQEQRRKYGGRSYVKEENTIPKSIEENYQLIDNLLKDIKVVDPAVGSGAFPVGMMNEIVKARSILSIYFTKERDVVELKRECIENSLYGVDIMPSAVDICQLRFWLSLVVDELDRNKIRPLPNLDNKIMCGNSLLEEFEGVKLFDESLLEEEIKDNRPEIERIDKEINEQYQTLGKIETGKLKADKEKVKKNIKKLERAKAKLQKTESNERNMTLGEVGKARRNEAKIKLNQLKAKQKEFFNSFDKDKKSELKKEIEQLEWDLIKVTLEEQGNEEALEKLNKLMRSKSKPFFLWKLYFAEVFQRENPGFDVVIANPPYVRVQKIDVSIKEAYINNYYAAKGKFDLYLLFTELGINLLNEKGSLAFIMPNKFTNTHYGENLRDFILRNTDIDSYVDFSDKGVFETATTYPCVIVLNKDKVVSNNFVYGHIKRMSSNLMRSLQFIFKNETFDNEDLYSFHCKQKDFNNSNWIFSEPEINELLNKLSDEKYATLKHFREQIYEGLITGNNKVFFINSETAKKNNLETELIYPLPKGKRIRKYFLGLHDYFVIYPYKKKNGKTVPVDLDEFPNIKQYFLQFRSELEKRSYLMKSGKNWWEIWNPRDITLFATTKIVTPNLSKENRFALDLISSSDRMVCIDHDCYGIILKDKTIQNYYLFLAILNSPITKFFVENISPMFSGGFYKYHTQYLDSLPIPLQLNPHRDRISSLVNQILSITKDVNYAENTDKQRQVNKIEEKINKLVYELYYLTPKEIKIIEDFNK